MDKYDWLYDAKLSELPEVYADIIEIYGVEFFKVFLEEFQGEQFYVPFCGNKIQFAPKEKIKEITLEEIPIQFRRFAERLGIESTVNFLRRYQGEYIYIPTEKNSLSRVKNENIRREYQDGKNIRELAHKYGVSSQWIRIIINQGDNPIRSSKENKVPEGQISLFD